MSERFEHSRATMWLVVALLVLVGRWCGDAQVIAGQNATMTSFGCSSFPTNVSTILTVDDVAFDYRELAYDLNWYTTGGTRCGRMFYRHKLRLKDQATDRVASSNTSFSFSFTSNTSRDDCGDGIMFTFEAYPNSTTLDKRLLKCSFEYTPLPSRDRVFAVKFGSRQQYNSFGNAENPSDSTIGVEVCTRDTLAPVRTQHNLCAGELNATTCGYFCGRTGRFSAWVDYDGKSKTLAVTCGYFCGRTGRFSAWVDYDGKSKTLAVTCGYFCGRTGRFSAWVDYDGKSKTLAVFFRTGSLETGGKPRTPVITVPDLALNSVLDEEMYVAITGSTYYPYPDREVHRVYAWNFNSSSASLPLPNSGSAKPGPKNNVGVIIGIFIPALVVICIALGLYMYIFVIRKYRNKQVAETVAPPKLPVYAGPGPVAQYSTAVPSSQAGPAWASSVFIEGTGSTDKVPYVSTDKVPYVGGR